ncbi:MAG: hypothetical protein GWP06_12530 [Actinobacteria bacterium]|nr:hypothetical protein [Actinomycetota bacterium]
MSEIQFFGNVDKNAKGEIASELPAWFHDVQLEILIESMRRKERQLERGEVPPEHAFMVKNEIENEKKKITEIQMSKPTLKGGQKDMVYKEYTSLAGQISDTMPTVREDRRGFVNPREELKRLKTRHINISDKMANACGVKPVRGKITGDQAAKCYRMMGKVLGENTTIEKLRREGRSESYRNMEDLTEKILKKVAG